MFEFFDVTDAGYSIYSNEVHFSKAYIPIVFTENGIVTEITV